MQSNWVPKIFLMTVELNSIFQHSIMTMKTYRFSSLLMTLHMCKTLQRQKSKGIETEFLIQISDQFQIDGHLSLLDATYKNFVSEDQVYPRGRDGIPFTGDELFNLSGNDLVQAPDRSGLIGLSYITPIDNGATITLRAQVYSQSETYLRQFNLDPYDKTGFVHNELHYFQVRFCEPKLLCLWRHLIILRTRMSLQILM